MIPRDVPDGGLLPGNNCWGLQRHPLAEAGYTGKGMTVVVFAFDGFDQSDMDSFSELFEVPPFTPEVVGGMPEHRNGRQPWTSR